MTLFFSLMSRGLKSVVISIVVTICCMSSFILALAAENTGSGVIDTGSIPKPGPAEAVKPDSNGFSLQNIPPLYKTPAMAGEGIWVKQDLSGKNEPGDFIYTTFYRPSEKFPNAIVYMMAFNMKNITAKLCLGSAEPYRKGSPSKIDDAMQPALLAVTNALWQTRHAGKGGIILGGEVLKKLEPGVATIIVYKNQTVDIVEWNDQMPISEIQDARQLHHLMAKDGKVVTSIMKRGQAVSAEIGLGSLLDESRPVIQVPAASPEEKPTSKLNFTSGDLWFLANRSAFGIRPDGNLVFAIGHHINTVDLAKALVLAGCVRVMHADANPGNCVGALYFRDANGKISGMTGLSPHQDKSTMERYLKANYPKDFFAFFRK